MWKVASREYFHATVPLLFYSLLNRKGDVLCCRICIVNACSRLLQLFKGTKIWIFSGHVAEMIMHS